MFKKVSQKSHSTCLTWNCKLKRVRIATLDMPHFQLLASLLNPNANHIVLG